MQTDRNRKLDKERALGILAHLNTKELQDLLDNDSKLDQLVSDNEQIKALSAEKQTLVASNKSLSEYNLSKEPALSQSKERLNYAYQQSQEIHRIVSEKKIRAERNSSSTSVEEALALLKTAADSLENETDIISERFLKGELDIDVFLESYIEKRSLTHNRKIKAEKMQEITKTKPPTTSQPMNQWQPSPAMPAHYMPQVPPQQPYGMPYGYRPSYPANPMSMPGAQQYMPRR